MHLSKPKIQNSCLKVKKKFNSEGRFPRAQQRIKHGITKETFSKMGYKERVELFNTNRDLYDQLVNQ